MADPVVCEGTCTVTVSVEAAPMTEEQLLDLGTLFGLFLGACVLVYCAKQLLNLFSVNPHGD